MANNNYLTRDEQKAWEYIKDKDTITNETLGLIYPEFSGKKRNKLLYSLYKKGYIKRAMRDLYYTVGDYHKLALRIKHGYIGLTSALRIHNLLDYEDFTIFVFTRDKYKELEVDNYLIKYIPTRYFFGYTEMDDLLVSTKEKTIFDCFLRIKYLNYSILTKAIYSSDINWKNFLKIFNSAPIGTRQKAGYVLELMKKETGFRVPRYVLTELKKGIVNPVKLGYGKNSVFSREWLVQDTLGKDIISWWYE